ncbi:type 2 lanthipeptide synthetase LanM family protein [Micromonospora sp. NPDC049359]|uniref:type 2 lanthipeptide synthetase LanM family protein n=1 Tax=Micromonospora sp. NPDC049359 TaxID=3364270 RepID=UPI0037B28751
MSTDLMRRWSTVPPFRTLPEDALRTRLSLPVGGSPPPAGDAPGSGPAELPHTLAESPVGWMTEEPVLWPLLPLWPRLADLHRALTEAGRAEGQGAAATVADRYLRSLLGDVRRLACRAAAEDLDAPVDEAGKAGEAPTARRTEAEAAKTLAVRYAARPAAAEFADRYAPLLRQVKHILDGYLRTFTEMLQRLRADGPLITPLLGGVEAGQMRAVRAVGDLHEPGAVLLLTFADDTQLLYKPRSLALEVQLTTVLQWLDSHEPGLAPRVPRSVDRGRYGWQEFVAWSPARSADEVRAFYRRSGALVALAYLMRATDLHYENVLCDGRSPVLVDPECLFTTSFRTRGDGVEEMGGVKATTVLDSGLLPEPGHRGDLPTALDLSMLGAVGERRQPRQIRELRVDEHGRSEFVMRSLPAEDATHMPVLDGRVVPVVGYEDTVADGFVAAYRMFLADRDHLDQLLAGFAGARVRHIVRPSWQYGKLLYELGHPDAARSALKQEEVVNTIWPANAHERQLALHLFGSERRGLLHGCIPTFERRAGDVDLLSNGELVHSSALLVSGLDLVRQRLRSLSAEDLRVQTGIIRATLSLLRIPADARHRQSYSPVRAATPDSDTVLRAATDIRDALTADMADNRGRAWWLGGVEVSSGMFGVRPSPFGLYDGVAGIALFAGYLDLITGSRSRLATSARSAMLVDAESVLQHSTLEQLARNRQLGVLNGLWGTVYVAACLGHSAGDPGLARWARDVAGRLAPAPLPTDCWDLLGGSAGIAATAAELATAFGPEVYAAAADRFLRSTAMQLESVLSAEEIPAGVAHGMSGAALAFGRGAGLFPGAGWDTAARVCIDAERSQRRPDAGGWHDALLAREGVPQEGKRQSWCRGGAGIGLVRLALGEEAAGGGALIDSEEKRDIDLAVRLTVEHGFGYDQSLCHGAMGALELLRAAGCEQEYGVHLGGLLAAAERHGWRTGLPRPLPDPGLFTGVAGVGFGLLRHLEPRAVPRVVTLSLPAGCRSPEGPVEEGARGDA